jgi:hypothetical protein
MKEYKVETNLLHAIDCRQQAYRKIFPKRNSREIRRIFSKGYKLTSTRNEFRFCGLHISIF